MFSSLLMKHCNDLTLRTYFYEQCSFCTVYYCIPMNLGKVFHFLSTFGTVPVFPILHPARKASNCIYIVIESSIEQGSFLYRNHIFVFCHLVYAVAMFKIIFINAFIIHNLIFPIKGKPV